jgi:hypothetical protein
VLVGGDIVTVRSAQFYWIDCNFHCGCDARCPDSTSDVAAWADEDQAITVAQDSGWVVYGYGFHVCPDHAVYVCDDCGTYDPADDVAERDGLCRPCWRQAVAS